MNIKPNYSNLFTSLFSNSSSGKTSGTSNFLADYASIKNGSYGKLMKAYYAKTSSDEKSSSSNALSSITGTTTSKDSASTLSKIQSSTDNLKEAADKLLTQGTKSVFQSEDEDALYKAVSSFVDSYNSVLTTAGSSNNSSILQKTLTMVNASKANKNLLSKVGIAIGEDNSLSLDKETFQSADKNTVKTLFNKTGSYGYAVSASASFINFKADTEAAKANTYSSMGNYANNYTSGSIFNSFF